RGRGVRAGARAGGEGVPGRAGAHRRRRGRARDARQARRGARITAMDLGLLLIDAESQKPVGQEGLPARSLASVPRTRAAAAAGQPDHLFSEAKDPNDLAAQRWGVIVPEEGGDAFLAAIARLVEARAAQQKIAPAAVRRLTFKKTDEPIAWIKANLPSADPA